MQGGTLYGYGIDQFNQDQFVLRTDKTNSAPLSDVLQTTENINAIFNLLRMKVLVPLKS